MKHPVTPTNLDEIVYQDGLIPVIAQDEATGAVLMLAWANKESLAASLETGTMTYYSRSRQALWAKGETSGHKQKLVSLTADCDKDAILAIVEQTGPACHQNTGTCWSDGGHKPTATELGVLDRLAAGRKAAPQGRYTDELLADPVFVASKIVEEANEVSAVLRGEDNEDTLEHEAADLLYHLIIALRGAGTTLEAVLQELRRR